MVDNYAILVGIGKYSDASTFPELSGPDNDVDIMKEWLTSAEGGNVSPDNITTLLSPEVIEPGTDPDSVPPITEDFKRAFKSLVYDKKSGFIVRPESRLYLYFSGHGFCEKKSLTPQATLYAANATREFPENIFGSYYALLARDKALFSEIVLVMDCCRDTAVNRPMDVPAVNEAGNSSSYNVRLFCVYAAPKGGKAQEREISERDNKVYGLLTHAIIKAFSEAQPDTGLFITGAALKRHLLETWTTLCIHCGSGENVPSPEIVLPTGTDIQFRSLNHGINQIFEFSDFPVVATAIDVFDSQSRLVVSCEVLPLPAASTAVWNGSSVANLVFEGKSFSLGLQPGYYKYVLSGGLSSSDLFAVLVGGGEHVRL